MRSWAACRSAPSADNSMLGSRKLAILRAGNGPGAGLPIDRDGLVTPNLLQRRQVRPGRRKALQKFGQTVHLTATQRSARRRRFSLTTDWTSNVRLSCGSKTCQRGKGRRAAVRMLQDLSHVAASAVGPVAPRSPRNFSLIAFDARAVAVPCDRSRLAQHYPCRSSHSGCNRLVGSPPDLRSRQKAQNM